MTDATFSAPPTSNAGLLDDLVEIFAAPSKVFERRRDAGYGKFLLVLMVLTAVIMLATMSLSAPFWDGQFDLAMQQAAAKGQAMPEGAAGEAARNIGRWTAMLGSVVAIPIFVWISALFVMLGGKLAGAPVGYKQGALIFTLAGFPRLISPIVMAVQGLLLDPSSIRSISDASLGPARFFDPTTTSPFLIGLLGNFDLINLWAFALIGIGIRVVGRGAKGSGWVGAGVVFACVLALSLIPAAFA